MSGNSEKASGFANVAIGKVKQGLGSAFGATNLKEEGAVQELKGHAQQALGDVKSATDSEVSGEDRDFKIRERAYDIWLQEGCPDGRHHEHWRQAEAEVDGSVVAMPIL